MKASTEPAHDPVNVQPATGIKDSQSPEPINPNPSTSFVRFVALKSNVS